MFQYLHADFAAYKGLFPEGFTENDLPSLLRLRYLTCHRRPVFLIKAGFYLFR